LSTKQSAGNQQHVGDQQPAGDQKPAGDQQPAGDNKAGWRSRVPRDLRARRTWIFKKIAGTQNAAKKTNPNPPSKLPINFLLPVEFR